MLTHGLTFEEMEAIPVVRHTCDHGWCIEPTHLIDGSKRDNAYDMIERGRFPFRYRNDGEPISIGQGFQPAPIAFGIVGVES